MTGLDRRGFVRTAGGCAAHLALMTAGLPRLARAQWATPTRFATVAEEPWGRLERITDGVWAMVSTPLTGDRTTLCNGGLVAGRDGVVMIEAFGTDAGARWMAERALALTGRAPSHLVVTHYHADHTGGLRGAHGTPGLRLHATEVTRDLTATRNQSPPTELLREAIVVDARQGATIDLGGRRVALTALDGHTASDVTVRVEDVPVLFTGDLVWHGMFPNYVDAIPSKLTRSVRALRASGATTFVPGHGTVANVRELDAYLGLLDAVESAARRAVERGDTAEAAGAAFRMPAGMEQWTLFNPRYFERAIGAWMRELAGTNPAGAGF